MSNSAKPKGSTTVKINKCTGRGGRRRVDSERERGRNGK